MAHQRTMLFAAACFGMLVFGVVMTTPGAVLPSLMERFALDKAAGGSLVSLMSLGVLAGSVVFGPVADRHGYRLLLAGSIVGIVVGMQLMAFATSPGVLRAGIVVAGFAGGVANGCAIGVVSDISGDRKAAMLSLLGIFFGVGAVGMPFAFAVLLDAYGYGSVIAVTAALLLLPGVALLLLRFPAPKPAAAVSLNHVTALLRQPLLLLLGAMLFLQSGLEITMGGWTATYFSEVLGLEGNRALFFLSLFWAGMMAGRLVLGTLLRDVAPARALPWFIAMALAGALLLLRATALLPAAGGTFLAGAGLAAGFPVVLGQVGDRYAALSGTAFSITLVMALTGGSIMPYGTGALADRYGLRMSLALVPAALLLQAVLFAVVLRRIAPQHARDRRTAARHHTAAGAGGAGGGGPERPT